MKKIFKNSRPLMAKLIVGVLLLALIGCTLVACGGAAKTTYTLEGNVQMNDNDGLTQEQLNKIATMLGNNAEAYSGFVAAYRGYDVTSEGFDTSVDRPMLDTVSVEGAKNVLAKYDTDGVLVYDKLDSEDVANIVGALKTDISLSTERGFFENIQYWIGTALLWITNTIGFGNYLVGICIFAIIVEIILLPLSIKQQKNSIKQAMLRPKEMAIRKRFAGRNDQATQQKLQQEIQELYQRENFNPMGGCLPLLVQFPVIIVLYNIVINPLVFVLGRAAGLSTALQTYFLAPKAAGGLGEAFASKSGTIEMLSMLKEKGSGALEGMKSFPFFSNGEAIYNELSSVIDSVPSFNIGPVNFGATPSFTSNYWLLLIPVLTFVVYFFSMKLTRKFTYQPVQNEQAAGAGCSMKIMDYSMPLMSVFFTFIVPGAIGVYWIFKSVIGTVKQFILSKTMPLPRFTEEDYKAAEKELNAKHPPKKKSSGGSGAKVRSLHHIDDDDDDYDETPSVTAKKPEEKSEQTNESSDEASSMISQAPLKKDENPKKAKKEKND